MNITFISNSDTIITSLTNMDSCPFNVNDVIKLSVSEPKPYEFEMYGKSYKERYIRLRSTYHLKDMRIIEKRTYLDIQTGILEIEFLCEII